MWLPWKRLMIRNNYMRIEEKMWLALQQPTLGIISPNFQFLRTKRKCQQKKLWIAVERLEIEVTIHVNKLFDARQLVDDVIYDLVSPIKKTCEADSQACTVIN